MSATPSLPAGRSVLRGYAFRGLGEGPGRPIARGEQFLEAEEPFSKDGALLGALRPWMTLDLDAGDHRRLGDRLEGWSCFTHGDWFVVVRLTPAGRFDHRTAYFAHARAFPADLVEGAVDPGALLGRSEAFERPRTGDEPAERVEVPPPAMVRPEQVAADPETAASLLSHLVQALLDQRPAVVAVPVDELAAGAPLHALVSFARAALPPRLKRVCRLRVYTRSADLFLERLGCDLLVVPEAVASDALAVRRDAVLLDRRGRRHAGDEPAPGLRAWAEKVTGWACEGPQALLEFAARFGPRVWDGSKGPPGDKEAVSVAVAYRLAQELAAGATPSSNLLGQLRNAAARIAPVTLPWGDLLAPEDWSRFPEREVLDLVLADPERLPGAAGELQAAARSALVQAVFDERLDPMVLDAVIESGGAGPSAPGPLQTALASGDSEGLLHLAGRLAAGALPLQRLVAGALLGRMREEPERTTELLIRRGAWSWWRRLVRGQDGEARGWALCWLASPHWAERRGNRGPDPRLEDWSLVVVDLGDRLDRSALEALFGDGRRGWPWIPLFADRQVGDLAVRMPDLGALATLVALCIDGGPLPRHDVERLALAAFAAERPELLALDASALRWFFDPATSGSLPDPSPEILRTLLGHAGAGRSRLVENLVSWLEAAVLANRPCEDLLRWADGLTERRSSPPSERAQEAARRLAARGHLGAAALLDPQLETWSRDRERSRRALAALSEGRVRDPVLGELARWIGPSGWRGSTPGAPHPFQALAAVASDEPLPAGTEPGRLWSSFTALMAAQPGLFGEPAAGGDGPLAAFELAAALFREVPAASLAVGLGAAAPADLAERATWWRSLLAGVDACRRGGGHRSGRDRPDVARALLGRLRPDLPERARAALAGVLWQDLDGPLAASAAASAYDDHSGGEA